MKRSLILAASALLLVPGTAAGDPLDTGYNHGSSTYYLLGNADNCWIKIASYEPPAPSVAVAAARVIDPNIASWGSVGAPWIGPRPSPLSSGGTSPANPAYSIFRKCFCLLSNYANPQISIRVRADDNVQVWLNSVTNELISPIIGNYFSGMGPPRAYPAAGQPSNPEFFRAGRNCLYVLVEDQLGHIGFTLAGTVNAAGLMPGMAFGPDGDFGPCGCPGGNPATGGGAIGQAAEGEAETVQAIIRFAEARRLQRLARPDFGVGGTGLLARR